MKEQHFTEPQLDIMRHHLSKRLKTWIGRPSTYAPINTIQKEDMLLLIIKFFPTRIRIYRYRFTC